MLLLGIDTTSRVSYVALVRDGSVLATRSGSEADATTESLLGLVVGVLTDAGLELSAVDSIVVGLGPGSYTGIRIGLATAHGLALGQHQSIVGRSVLMARAFGSSGKTPFIVPFVSASSQEYFYAVLTRDGEALRIVNDIDAVKKEELSRRCCELLDKAADEIELLAVEPEGLGAEVERHPAALLALYAASTQDEDVPLEPIYAKGVNARTLAERQLAKDKGGC